MKKNAQGCAMHHLKPDTPSAKIVVTDSVRCVVFFPFAVYSIKT